METYKKDQEYTLKVVNTDNEVKEIKYTPNKDMSKPEMIMALKSKYKNFFKLIEAKQIDFGNDEEYTAYIVDKDFDLDTLPDDVNYTLVHNLPKTGTKMFLTTRPLTDKERKEFNIRLNSEEVTPEEMKELFSEDKDVQSEIIQHRQNKLDDLHSDIRYDFEEAYKDWGNEVSKTKSGFVNEYMSEFCNDFDEVNWRKYIVAISEVDKIYEKYKDIEDWEIPEDVKTRLYELITDYVQDYLTSVYSKKTESVIRYVIHKDGDVVDGFGGNTYFNDYNQALDTAEELKADDVEMYVYNNEKEADKRELPNNTKCIWKNGKKITEDKKSEPVIVISYGRGMRFPDRKTAIDYYKECIEGTDPNGAENYSYQNILYELMHTDKDVVYDTDDETEYDWWIQKGKPTDDVSDELLKAHLGENKIMEKEDLSDKDMKELDEYTETEIRKMYDKYCSENNDKKSFEEWQKENVDSALINELEYEFFSNRKKTEDLDVDDKVYEDGFIGQSLNTLLTYIDDGHDIADDTYDGCVVFFPPVNELDDTDNYDLYIQGLSHTLKVVEGFDENDVNIIVNITDYVIANKDVLLDLFEVYGETKEDIEEDLVCRIMPLVISGYTTDSVYKILLNTVNGGK